MDSPDNGVTEGKPCFHQFTDVCDMHYCNKYKTCLHPNSGPDPHAVRVTAKDVLEGAMEEHVYDGVPVTLRGRRAYHGLCGTCGDRWDDGHGQDGNCQPNAEPLEDSLVRAVDTLRDEGNVLAKKFADQSPGGAPYPSPTKLDVPAYRRAKAGRFGITAHPQVEAEQNDIQVSLSLIHI